MAPAKARGDGGKTGRFVPNSRKYTQEKQPKVLRIGIVESGRIIQEKFIPHGKDVTVGTSEKCDFNLSGEASPSRTRLFEYRHGCYSVVLDENITGRVNGPNGIEDISQIVTSRKSRGPALLRLELDDDSRGKLILGGSTLLFQMVRRAPTQPKPQLPSTVRGGWAKSIDWAFTSLLVISCVLQVSFVIWLVNQDWPVQPTFDMNSDYIQRLFDTRPSYVDAERVQKALELERSPLASAAEPEAALPATPAVQESERSTTRSGRTRPNPSTSASSGSADRVRLALQERASSLLAEAGLLGSLNPEAEGAVADVLAGGRVSADQDEILAQIDGVSLATGQPAILRRPGKGVSTDAVDIGSLRTRLSGNQEVSSGDVGSEITLDPRVRTEPPTIQNDTTSDLDPGAVRQTITRNLGGIKACYETSLRRNHSLAGRVVINFTVSDSGRVTRASAVQNTVSPEVGSCIERRIRAIRFPSSTGTVTFRHPFIFHHGG